VVGVEKNASKIAQARKNCPGIEFVRQDVLKLPFACESFDTVALPEILEHVSESVGDRMLETAWRFLKPGGRLVVSVPNENCVPSRTHVRQFSRKSLAAILSRFGKPYLETRQPYKWLIMYVEKISST
jgi:ubiquinone/menaquinone biosynthesis C-methylase UbiE